MVKRSNSSNSKSVEIEVWSYEAKVAEIEDIIARIEAGELELADVFEEFAKAVEYLGECESFLQQRQQQVDLLIETLDDK
ncbi:MAG: exodeoxyribonuclease VII small subunit [Pelatocladus maniniholoensis HA4357-MV3]|jgi:exodeoxyribonuclease VII small subunit|uniref:Exodeoxyribonuclease 7 small subunit n=1 Tax=Pelatocladus maniniholoensis HA4357-MV3 TaxID=1117104 RepID=A0A9E3LVS9_9NOST|nr:exodeoxyribonuclease VII small subunit [Pelatocladus maniniholoensis HA4357-MV3]BAZ65923.1 exodeoxyribonuclease VII small subunit [Fischerella sp. NIES-4106]